MIRLLRPLGRTLLVGGLVLCVVTAFLAITDQAFFDARDALARHPDHILFQAQYYDALAKHLAYIITAVLSGFVGVFGSTVLLALDAILRRLERRDPSA